MKKKLFLSVVSIALLVSMNIFAGGNLFKAIEDENLTEVERLIKEEKVDVNEAEKNGATPLYWACEKNNINIVKLLLPKCTQKTINKAYCYDDDGGTPLHVACYHNNIDIVKLLLQNDADINKINNHGDTPLHFACYKNNIEIVKILLPKCTQKTVNKVNNDNDDGKTPLHIACYNNNIEIVKLLLPKCTKETINKAE